VDLTAATTGCDRQERDTYESHDAKQYHRVSPDLKWFDHAAR
jgi:hypothetical protein